MEGLAPPLALIFRLEVAIERGESVRKACYEIVHGSSDSIHEQLRRLLRGFDMGEEINLSMLGALSPERQCLFELIWRGLQGEPILSALRNLRDEVKRAADAEMEDYLARLPFRALLPLLLLIFPAFLILLFGPLLSGMIGGVS